jgi:heme o synthase
MSGVSNYLELCKFRLIAMVLATTAVGFILATGRPASWAGFWLTLIGTGLTAGGAGAMNQVLEVEQDAKMLRTCRRPLPAGRLSRMRAFIFSVLLILSGLGVLNEFVNPLTALLGLANVLIYVAIYTPLKRRTSLCTLIGSICGALPPIMGSTGAIGRISLGAVMLAFILFFWQVPHFLSLAWLYRGDYEKAGYRILPVIDSSNSLTSLAIVTYCLALTPMGLVATLCGSSGYLFAAASLALGFGLFLLALNLQTAKNRLSARRVFLATLLYLPLMMIFMLADMKW